MKDYDKKYTESTIMEIMKDVKVLSCENYDDEIFTQLKYRGIWVPYIVSSYGRFFSVYYYHKEVVNLHELKLSRDKDGYLIFGIRPTPGTKKTIKCHRAVAESFVPNYDKNKNTVVNHLDGNKSNNHYWNLEWTTNEGNIQHAIKTGLRDGVGSNNPNNKYSEYQIINICKMLSQNFSIRHISRSMDIPYSTIVNVLYKRNWNHITKDYDFSMYSYGRPEKYTRKIDKACQMIASNKYTYKEISENTGISIHIISDISRGRTHRDVLSKYIEISSK